MKKTALYNDGYCLSYAEYGDPDGWPVLVQHGLIASINDGQLFNRLTEAGARVISAARPGYGESSPYEMKNLAEWGDIAAVLVQQLGLAQFDVLGISSGAPYSYAIASRLPEQVRRIFILSGTPALFDDGVLSFWPYPVNRQAALAEMQALSRELFFSDLSEAELAQDDIKDSMMNDCFGVAQDLRLRCLDWGFQLSQVQGRVYMRHSKSDGSVPLVTAELTAKMLPDCWLEVREADVHFSQAVLDDFIRTVVVEHGGSA